MHPTIDVIVAFQSQTKKQKNLTDLGACKGATGSRWMCSLHADRCQWNRPAPFGRFQTPSLGRSQCQELGGYYSGTPEIVQPTSSVGEAKEETGDDQAPPSLDLHDEVVKMNRI